MISKRVLFSGSVVLENQLPNFNFREKGAFYIGPIFQPFIKANASSIWARL